MHLETIARVNNEKSLIFDDNIIKMLKPGSIVKVVIDEEEVFTQKKNAVDFVLNVANESTLGLKDQIISREWIHSKD